MSDTNTEKSDQETRSLLLLTLWKFDTVFIVCDIYLSNSIKGGEKRLRVEGKRYGFKSTSMRLPSDMRNFQRNGQNREMLFNLLEAAIIEEKQNLHQVMSTLVH